MAHLLSTFEAALNFLSEALDNNVSYSTAPWNSQLELCNQHHHQGHVMEVVNRLAEVDEDGEAEVVEVVGQDEDEQVM